MLVGQGSGRNGDYYLFRPAGVPADASMFVDFLGQRAWRGLAEAVAFDDAFACDRDSVGFAQNAAGVWTSFAADVARVTDRGLLVEPAATNGVRNNTNAGAVVGAPGTLPTNWAASLVGLAREVTGTGTENGLPYSEHRFSGTASGTMLLLYFDTSTGIAASVGQTWTASFGLRIVDEPDPPVGYGIRLHEYASGASGSNTTQAVAATGLMQMFEASRTLTGGATTAIRPGFTVTLVSGQTYDFTVRIYAPQCELAAAASSPILTAGTAASRSADTNTFDLPAGTHDLTFTFDDLSTQVIAGQSGNVAIPTNLNRRVIRSMTAVAA